MCRVLAECVVLMDIHKHTIYSFIHQLFFNDKPTKFFFFIVSFFYIYKKYQQ